MELNKIAKEIEITIKLNKDEAEVLEEVILFALDYEAENHRFTNAEKEMANRLYRFLDGKEYIEQK